MSAASCDAVTRNAMCYIHPSMISLSSFPQTQYVAPFVQLHHHKVEGITNVVTSETAFQQQSLHAERDAMISRGLNANTRSSDKTGRAKDDRS